MNLNKVNLAFILLLLSDTLLFASWHSLEPRATDQNLQRIYFPDLSHGWAVGNNGAIVKTSDGGVTWVAQNSNTTDTLFDVYFSDSLHGWAVGRHGCMVKTDNGGTIWQKMLKRADIRLIKVKSGGKDTVIVISAFQLIFKSVNNGDTWETLMYPPNNLMDASIINPQNIWLLYFKGAIDKTTDGGTNWQRIRDTNGVFSSAYLFRLNDSIGWSFDYKSGFRGTTDSGRTWRILGQPSDQFVEYTSFKFISLQTGYMVMNANVTASLFKTTDGGLNWTIDSSLVNVPEYFWDLYFDQNHNGWAVGNFGAIYTNKPMPGADIRRINQIKPTQKTSGIIYEKGKLRIINAENITKIRLYNCKGSLVKETNSLPAKASADGVEIDISRLACGSYILKVSEGAINKSMLFIKR
jgi:photosystem II stability/assembly factor-like uncharacterized protein